MLTLTSPVETPLHRLRAGVKLGALALATVALFQLKEPLWLGLCLCVVMLAYLACGIRFARHGLRTIRPLWPVLVVIGIWHLAISAPLEGAVILLRMVTAIGAANLVTMTTKLADMMALFAWLARPLSPMIPPARLAMAFALVIRFIPVLGTRAAELSDAYRARSSKARAGIRIAAPLALAALDEADRAAEALRARGGSP